MEVVPLCKKEERWPIIHMKMTLPDAQKYWLTLISISNSVISIISLIYRFEVVTLSTMSRLSVY